jgi:hypothetical protein
MAIILRSDHLSQVVELSDPINCISDIFTSFVAVKFNNNTLMLRRREVKSMSEPNEGRTLMIASREGRCETPIDIKK